MTVEDTCQGEFEGCHWASRSALVGAGSLFAVPPDARPICDTSRKNDKGGTTMKLKLRNCRRLAVGAALACGAILLPTAAVVASATSGAPGAVASCRATSTEVWAAVEGDGTAGTIYYELEFSNVGRQACTLHGYPTVWAVSPTGLQIGKPASHRGVPGTVTLQPGATVHAILGVVDTGALCSGPGVAAAGLKVVPPGQTVSKAAGEADEVENFSVHVCPHQSSMNVLPIHSGVGIPNYTFS